MVFIIVGRKKLEVKKRFSMIVFQNKSDIIRKHGTYHFFKE